MRISDPPLNLVQDLAIRKEFMQPWGVCKFRLEINGEKCRWDAGESGNRGENQKTRDTDISGICELLRW